MTSANASAALPPKAGTADRRLVLVELNEVNFDVAALYVQRLGLRNLDRLLKGCVRRTSAEQNYEQLEPWIQWVSAHSGLTADEHGIFRLGDIVGSQVPQMFEQIEAQGYRVGCVSAMNAENRLRAPAYFVPDPWTRTPHDGSTWSGRLAPAVSQVVNDNADGRLTLRSAVALLMGVLRFAQPRHYRNYLRVGLRSRGAPWRKALVLDLFLHDLHMALFKAAKPHFSTVFLNAGAHIQHHYFFNARTESGQGPRNPDWYVDAEADPVAEMLQLYDLIVGEYLDLPGTDVIIATGLTQIPYDRVKFYYRLRNHEEFVHKLGIACQSVEPLMTRDFIIKFDNPALALAAQQVLAQVKVEGSGAPIFGDIDNRGDSLFVALSYPNEIDADLRVRSGEAVFALAPHVVFVAIKNGMHKGEGFAFFQGRAAGYATQEADHVSNLYHSIRAYFGPSASAAVPPSS